MEQQGELSEGQLKEEQLAEHTEALLALLPQYGGNGSSLPRDMSLNMAPAISNSILTCRPNVRRFTTIESDSHSTLSYRPNI
mmetsp:Transcript_14396/g.25129  ORF Transcript_14396/g.25129 Transcript_14396/m.25129 type:complete len:82 (+) Transcript_14396:624-869(+)